MEFFTSAIDTMKVTVTALGGGLGVWGIINLLEGYGNDNPGANEPVKIPATITPMFRPGKALKETVL